MRILNIIDIGTRIVIGISQQKPGNVIGRINTGLRCCDYEMNSTPHRPWLTVRTPFPINRHFERAAGASAARRLRNPLAVAYLNFGVCLVAGRSLTPHTPPHDLRSR